MMPQYVMYMFDGMYHVQKLTTSSDCQSTVDQTVMTDEMHHPFANFR